MLYDLVVFESEQIVEGRMHTAVVALTGAEHKVALGEYAMDMLIVDTSPAIILVFQCGS